MSSLRASFFPIDINDLQLFSALQIKHPVQLHNHLQIVCINLHYTVDKGMYYVYNKW